MRPPHHTVTISEIAAAVIRKAWKADAFTTHMLRTDGESRKQVGIHVEYPDQPERWATAFDPTVCCPDLKKYVHKPVTSVIGDRSRERIRFHRGVRCLCLARSFRGPRVACGCAV